jgi:hypothetical protein
MKRDYLGRYLFGWGSGFMSAATFGAALRDWWGPPLLAILGAAVMIFGARMFLIGPTESEAKPEQPMRDPGEGLWISARSRFD